MTLSGLGANVFARSACDPFQTSAIRTQNAASTWSTSGMVFARAVALCQRAWCNRERTIGRLLKSLLRGGVRARRFVATKTSAVLLFTGGTSFRDDRQAGCY